jgi:putative Ca2+/H+ antiporter (TMEM165/GDT1 family)
MDLGWLTAGAIVFVTIFVFEFFDKTNLGNVAMSAKSSPFHVWVGAAIAFLVSTTIAVTIGTLILAFLLPQILYVKVGGGALLVAYGAWCLLKARKDEPAKEEMDKGKVVMGAFLLILFLEMGDETQILTILFVASFGNILLVFVAAVAALWSMSALGVKLGSLMKGRISQVALERVSSVLMILVGALLIVYYLGAP